MKIFRYFSFILFPSLFPFSPFLLPFDAHAAAVINNSPTMSLNQGLVGYWTFDGVEECDVH